MLTPKERSLRARIGAHRLHATHDPKQTTSKARQTFLARFEKEVDPEGILPPEERQRRAEHARKAHFTKLALKSARARSSKVKEKPPGPQAAGGVVSKSDALEGDERAA